MKRMLLSVVFFGVAVVSVVGAENPISASIVPGADLLVRCDVAKLMAAPAVKALEAKSEDAEPEELDADEVEALMKRHLGLVKEDFVAVVGTAATAPLYAMEQGAAPDWNALSAAVVAILAKPVTMAQLKAFVAASSEQTGGEFETLKVSGRDVIKLLPDSPSEPPLLVTLSDTGGAAYFAMSESGMVALLARATGAAQAELSPMLMTLRATLPAGMQLFYLYEAPETLRTKIKESASGGGAGAGAMNPGLSMGLGMLRMFENLRSVGLGVGATEAFRLHLGADLGGAPQAQQAALILKNMLLPLLQMKLATMTPPGGAPIDASSLISVSSQDTTLSLGLTLDQALIEALGGMATGAMMGGMMGSGISAEME
jgi:hypothetical protein